MKNVMHHALAIGIGVVQIGSFLYVKKKGNKNLTDTARNWLIGINLLMGMMAVYGLRTLDAPSSQPVDTPPMSFFEKSKMALNLVDMAMMLMFAYVVSKRQELNLQPALRRQLHYAFAAMCVFQAFLIARTFIHR